MESYKLTINRSYYSQTAHEFNLPTGHTCPSALVCKISVDRKTGKFNDESSRFRCYAASAERYPTARKRRWLNYDYVAAGGVVDIPYKCKRVRIHQSGDFFSQEYLDMWLGVCENNPLVEFWAFTKSINFWIKRLGRMPRNLTLTASYGGKHDHLIKHYGLKSIKVVKSIKDSGGLPIDSNAARMKTGDFCILDTTMREHKGCTGVPHGDGLIKEKTEYIPGKVTYLYF